MWPLVRTFPFFSVIVTAGLLIAVFSRRVGIFAQIALALSTVWMAYRLVAWLLALRDRQRRHRIEIAHTAAAEGSGEGEPLISLVYFLEDPREATEDTIRECFSQALELRFDPDDENASEFVLDINPPKPGPDDRIQHFMVRIPQGLFNVLVSRDPYIDNPSEFAREKIRDKRLRKAVEKHLAWISVDLMGEAESAEDRTEAYQIIGKALAAMAGPDCLAIYSPELQRCNEFDLSLIDVLRSNDPLELFNEPTFEPVIEVNEDDPRMEEAVREAMSRWGEFVAQFDKRSDPMDDRFIIKAEFTENNRSEFMWVMVTEATGDIITGTLMNDPHELVEVHRGATVEVELERLNDWICPGPDGEAIGGFTLKVLTDEE